MLYEKLNLSLRKGLSAVCVCVCVCLNKVDAQTIQVSNACDLAQQLNAASAGTIIEVVADINLDDLVNCSTTSTLPLTVKAGVTLKGTFDLITNPNGSMLFSDSHRSSYYSTSHFLLAMQLCTSSCTHPTVIKNLRIKGPSKSWQEFNNGVDASNNFEPLKLAIGGIIVLKSPANTTGENCIIENCEIFGFTYCAIETRERNKDITIQNCFIHHNNGATYAGQGYGVWLRSDNNSGGATGLNILNNVFDDCRDAIDGTAPAHDQKMDWNIVSNSIQCFGGGINRHNSNGNSPISWNIPSNCFFFQTEPAPPVCITNSSTQNLTQTILDKSPGNINIDGNIIHNLSSISVNFPGFNDGTNNFLQNLEIRNNTFKNKLEAADANCNSVAVNHGYAHVADNYIENCIWNEARQTGQFNNTATENAFSYKPGQVVSYPNSPQPPEFTFQINDASGQLPFSNSNEGTLVTNPGTNLTMSITPVQLNGSSTDLIYIIRTNPSDGNGTINHYYDNQIITTSNTNIPLGNYAHPGLYGIDVMAIDKSVNASGLLTFHSSDWKHISLNLIPQDDHQLIFDIKDSYNEYHHQTTGSTSAGIYKQVELNGTCIWRQDISEGGDGWQRVVIDLSQPLPSSNPCSPGIIPLSLLRFDNSPNVISFSIYIDPNTPVDNRVVSGMLVWIDNVYLKKKGIHEGDNLIMDGGIENSEALGSAANQGKPWYVQNAYVFSGCTALGFGTNRSYEPEENPIGNSPDAINSFQSNPSSPEAKADINTIERKAGRKALQLKLPRLLYEPACTAYNSSSNNPYNGRVISVCTQFDVTDFLTCDDYIDANIPALEEFKAAIEATCTGSPCTLSDKVMYLEEDLSLPYTFNNITVNELILTGCGVVFKNPVGQTTPVKITVNNNGTLKILRTGTNPNFKVNRLFACERMWQGIVVNNGGELEISGSQAFGNPRNHIEDALAAVHASGTALVNLFGNDFDGNQASVILENGNFSNAVIQANRFTCNRGSMRRAPLNGMIPFYHVQLQNVCATCTSYSNFPKIGRNANSNGNLFENAFGGISLFDAKAIVYNNTFNNIYNNGTYHASHSGTGIFIDNRQISSGKILIGGEKAYEPNTFTNVNIGAMVINHRKDFEITIAGNSFDNSAFGLQGHGSGSNFYNTALTFQYPANAARQFSEIFIFNNTILNHRIGIHAINYNKIKIGLNASGSFGTGFANTITFNLGSSPAPDVHYKGIWLQNCNGAKVVSNEITNDVPATGTDNFRGIDLEASVDCKINCNTITNLTRSINFTGNCNLTKLKYNNMSGYDHGVHLEPNAFLPAQGDLDATSGQYFPYDNWWGYTGTEPPSVLKVSEANTPVLWYYQGATSPLNPYYPLPATFNIVPIFTPNSGNNDCQDFARYESRENSIAKTVNDSLEFDEYPEENMYQAKMVVYKALKQDSALIHQGKPDDHVYEYFVACMDAGNMGLLDSVGTLMNDSTTNVIASNINSSINDTNNVEYFSKTMHEIQLTLFATGELSPSDSATLDYIAHLPLTLAGNAIYTAAAILGLEIHQLFSSEARKSDVNPKKEKPLTKNDVFMYPNPVFDKAYFYLKPLVAENLALIEIYDNAGNKIMMLPADTYKIHEVNVQSFAAGLYSYRVICNNREFKGTFSKFK